MSDLDADLYGGTCSPSFEVQQPLSEKIDLYGNDDSEYAAPPDHASAPEKSEPQESPIVTKAESPPPTKAAVAAQPISTPPKPEPEPSLSPVDQTSIQTYSTTDNSGFANQPTQQIPTYQDNDSSEYREPPPNRADQSYPGALNRPVRPSEMKEEG